MIERVFHCDWRDCDGHLRTASLHPPEPFLTVAGGAEKHLHFCGWDCLLKFSGEKPPEITVALDDDA